MTDNERAALLALRKSVTYTKDLCRVQLKYHSSLSSEVVEEINRIGNDCIANMLSIDSLLKGKDVSDQPERI